MAMTRALLLCLVVLTGGCASSKAHDEPVGLTVKLSSFLQLRLACADYDELSKNLTHGKERLVFTALTRGGESLLELWADKEREDWTAVLHTLPDNEGCIVATGIGVVKEMPGTEAHLQ